VLRVAEAGGEWRTTSSRVFLVDGHPASRLGLKNFLDANHMRVVGEAGDGEEILLLVEEMRPDLVVLDLNLSGETESIEFCRRIKSLPEATRTSLHRVRICRGRVVLFAGRYRELRPQAYYLRRATKRRAVHRGRRAGLAPGCTGSSTACRVPI
jgi:CheY-like chemotaxis protein